ncbi:MAG: LysR family transcriptional regulator [Spirochaetales bacterium]|nr:LysR family transcriptional regulator [Spirochaetales bacterium]
MELLQLRYFQTVARMESITSAANYYGVPQPSMSQAISSLEESLGGVKLFDRRKSRVFLNDKGKLFLEYVDKALLELDKGVDLLSDKTKDVVSGTVRLKIMENHRQVLTCIPEFSKLYPNVNFFVSHGYQEEASVSYDICISSNTSYKHMSWHVPFIRESLVLAVHQKSPLANRESISINELRNQKFITTSPQSELYDKTVKWCREKGFEPNIQVFCDDPYYIRKYVSEEMGVALAPSVS